MDGPVYRFLCSSAGHCRVHAFLLAPFGFGSNVALTHCPLVAHVIMYYTVYCQGAQCQTLVLYVFILPNLQQYFSLIRNERTLLVVKQTNMAILYCCWVSTAKACSLTKLSCCVIAPACMLLCSQLTAHVCASQSQHVHTGCFWVRDFPRSRVRNKLPHN